MHQEAEPPGRDLAMQTDMSPLGEGGWVAANSCRLMSQLETLTQNVKERNTVKWLKQQGGCTHKNEDLLRSTAKKKGN